MFQVFQYPLFRIDELDTVTRDDDATYAMFQYPLFRIDELDSGTAPTTLRWTGFSIRSFGSMNWTLNQHATAGANSQFQYPLFRIDELDDMDRINGAGRILFQYPLFRIDELDERAS